MKTVHTSLRMIPGGSGLAVLTAAAVRLASAADAPSPSKVEHPVKETELTTLTLTTEAVTRLGIATRPVERKKVPGERLYGGEITLPAGGGGGGSLAALVVPQTPAELLKLAEQQINADGDVAQAKVKMDAARVTLERAEKLLAGQSGSQKAADAAREAYDLGRVAHEQAMARRALLGPAIQTSAEARSWRVRVALPAADAALLEPAGKARVSLPGATADKALTAERESDAPPSASALNATIDWYFTLKDEAAVHRPGERVEVRLALRGANEERSTVAWGAVLHDVHGGQWVYENTAPGVFVRRRVQAERIAGTDAVLASGPPPGAKIVVTGAAELFGSEFGAGK